MSRRREDTYTGDETSAGGFEATYSDRYDDSPTLAECEQDAIEMGEEVKTRW